MGILKQIRKAIVGCKATIGIKVYRASTGKWENRGVISHCYRGGILKPFRILWQYVKGRINKKSN